MVLDVNHWRRVKVENPKVPTFVCFKDKRSRWCCFIQACDHFPLKLKCFFSSIRADDNSYALYEEGHIVEVRGERRWILLRLYNTIERAVIYVTLAEGSFTNNVFCCFHEDLLVVEDAIHGETVHCYYEREYRKAQQ